MSFDQTLETVQKFKQNNLTAKISRIEREMQGLTTDRMQSVFNSEGIADSLLLAAFDIKAASAQIDVVIHAVGILLSLPYLMDKGEQIQYLSLGAGNTGRDFDLETNLRVAEFKFINWQGGAEAIRQNSLFIDLFNLVVFEGQKKRVLYVLDKQQPLKFLKNNRSISSVLSKNQTARERFANMYGNNYRTVSEYYEDVKDIIDIIDLKDSVPIFRQIY